MAPLIKTSLGINNLLADSLIQVNPDTSLKIVYNSSLFNFNVDSLVNFPDTISKQVYHLTGSITVNPGQLIMNSTSHTYMNPGHSGEVRKIVVKSGNIILKIKNSLSQKVLCTYQIPCTSFNGTPFTYTDLLPAAGNNGPALYQKAIDISGYTIDLTGPLGNSSNTITSTVQAWIDPNGSTVTITANDSLQMSSSFNNLVIGYAQGYFGNQTSNPGLQKTYFSLFHKITDGTLSLEDLHLKLNITNGYGVDAAFVLQQLKSVNSHTHNAVALNSSIINSTIHINRAVETYNPMNPVIPSVSTFNLDNSNFKQLVENLPDSLEYSLNLSTDPLGNVSSGNDFMYSGYGFNADLDLEIPLSLVAHNLTLTDTMSFNLTKPGSSYELNHGTLTLIADNGFPFSAMAQIYLLDNGVKTDSLVTFSSVIQSAPIDNNYKVTSKKRSLIYIPVSGEKLKHLYSAKKMIIVARFNTTGQPHYVKIYSGYLLDLKLTGDFNMTVNK